MHARPVVCVLERDWEKEVESLEEWWTGGCNCHMLVMVVIVASGPVPSRSWILAAMTLRNCGAVADAGE